MANEDSSILDAKTYMRLRVILECRRDENIESIQTLKEKHINFPRVLDQDIRTFIQEDILQNDLIWPGTRDLFNIAWGRAFFGELTVLARKTIDEVLAQLPENPCPNCPGDMEIIERIGDEAFARCPDCGITNR